ncbi:MAG: TolC family protein [Planctomycetota bacterium]
MRLFCVLSFILVLLVSCSSSHSQSQSITANIEKQYRPGGEKPPLPTLKSDSPLSDFITYALLNNHSVESAFYDWKKAVEEITVAQSLPDPKLTLSAEVISSMEKLLVGFMQDIPGSGKRGLEAEAFSAEAQKKRYIFEEKLLETTFNVKQIYYGIGLLNEKIRLFKEIVGLVDTQEQSIWANLKAGLASNEDLVMVQSEQAGLHNELVSLNDSFKPLITRWRQALGIGPNEVQPPLPNTAFTEHILPPETDLLKEALEHNIRLKTLSSEVKQAQAILELSYKNKNPDFGIGLGTDIKNDKLNWMPEISITLPIWHQKIAAEIASAQAGQKQINAKLSAEEINVAVLLAEKSFAWRELQRQSQLIREKLMPLAELKLNNIEAYYKTGKTGFTDWFNSRRELLELKIQLVVVNAQRETIFDDISLMVLSNKPEEISKIIK